jgi:hypothetical protein
MDEWKKLSLYLPFSNSDLGILKASAAPKKLVKLRAHNMGGREASPSLLQLDEANGLGSDAP